MSLNEREIANRMEQYLLNAIRSRIPSEDAALEYLYSHHRLCLTNEDKSDEPFWFPVSSREQVLNIKRQFCPAVPYTASEAEQIVNIVMVGYHIDFSRPTFMSYDLNRDMPMMYF